MSKSVFLNTLLSIFAKTLNFYQEVNNTQLETASLLLQETLLLLEKFKMPELNKDLQFPETRKCAECFYFKDDKCVYKPSTERAKNPDDDCDYNAPKSETNISWRWD